MNLYDVQELYAMARYVTGATGMALLQKVLS